MRRRSFLKAALGAPLVAAGCRGGKPRVVLYCAQDREFAEAVLADFTARTGIEVAPKFDTEADKSVGLVEELIREKGRPRCDVFWNNEVLGTIRLRRHDALQPYESPSAEPYPAWSKAPDRSWQAFAARARVMLVNRKLASENNRPKGLFDLTQPRWKGKAALARPFFGTTATHAVCLFAALGAEKAGQFFKDLIANDVQVVPGNKQSAQAVSRGEAAIGLTDTDDAIIEVEAGYAVDIIYPDSAKSALGTLFLPNTLALIRSGPNPDGGRKLIDYLLSAEIEGKLAANASRQIPLNPNVEAKLPASILRPEAVQTMTVDFEKAADVWDAAQTTLRKLFAR